MKAYRCPEWSLLASTVLCHLPESVSSSRILVRLPWTVDCIFQATNNELYFVFWHFVHAVSYFQLYFVNFIWHFVHGVSYFPSLMGGWVCFLRSPLYSPQTLMCRKCSLAMTSQNMFLTQESGVSVNLCQCCGIFIFIYGFVKHPVIFLWWVAKNSHAVQVRGVMGWSVI